ncbi:MAG: S53 family peptidase, partial [Frankiales bacterium]|nr:S53 family peptidase [Frankiales bacterium]
MQLSRVGVLGVVMTATTTAGLVLGSVAPAPFTGTPLPRRVAVPVIRSAPLRPQISLDRLVSTSPRPPTTATCRRRYGDPCYSPRQLRHAYRVNATGLTGRGVTVAIVDSFGSPTIRHDVHVFSQAFGLPDAHLRIVQPSGKPPAFQPGVHDMGGWASETSLDVEYVHAMAPAAHIVLVETPTAETEGVHGFPAMMHAEKWLLKHTPTAVISQSFGATEETFKDPSRLRKLRYAFKAAQRHHVTVLAASGDDGATDFKSDESSLYGHRVNSWPSSDPLVTSVGGTQVHLDNKGNRFRPDSVWNDRAFEGGASGGGRSTVFTRPAFQHRVQSIVGAARGTPDISMNAASSSQVLVYESFRGNGGWHQIAGTSEATPLFAGIVALAVQQAGHRLGDLNPALYAMRGRASKGIVDVIGGSNSYAGVKGYRVRRGYDL